MAEKEINIEVIKRTQEILGKYVQKPPLTEKLLQKPPFRFLFDVFNVVIKDTGCFAGLYTSQELNYENIKDRDDKMRFLQKMIDVVKITTGAPLTVRTSKIVSGHEAEKTNELLITMGQIIDQKLDWQSAVQQVVNGAQSNKQKSTEKSKKPKEKDSEKPKDKEKKVTKEPKVSSSSKTIKKEEKVKKDGTERAVKDKEKEKEGKDKLKTRRSSKDSEDKKTAKSSENPDKKKSLKSTRSINQSTDLSSIQTNSSSKIEPVSEKTQESSAKSRKNSASKQEILNESKALKETDSRKSSSQSRSSGSGQRKILKEELNLEESLPNEINSQESLDGIQDLNLQAGSVETAAMPLPKHPNTPAKSIPEPLLNKKPSEEQTVVKRESTFTRENSLETSRPRTSLRPPSARPASARPGAPRRRDKNVEIILQPNEPVTMSGINVRLDAFKDLDDDGEHLVVIEDPLNTDTLITSQDDTGDSNLDPEKLEQQGHLVQQILETQKELVQKTDDTTKEKVDKRINSASVRQTSARQMNSLLDIVQNLTKSVNPLGKLMDFVPEDIDAMQLELSMWSEAYVQAAQELKREKTLTEETTEPLKHQLAQIEETIKEYREMVDSSRVKVLQNSERILKLLTN